MRRILFVCHGNICRSVMAEYMCRYFRPDIYCESRGVSFEEEGNDIYPPAKKCLDRHGIPYGRHHAARIRKEDYDDFDVIYAMDRSNLRVLERLIDDREHKIRLLKETEIDDPWWTGRYDEVYEQILEELEKL